MQSKNDMQSPATPTPANASGQAGEGGAGSFGEGLRDYAGNRITVGSWIIYAALYGRCAALKCGVVTGLASRTSGWTEKVTPTIKALTADQNYAGWEVQNKGRPITLAFLDRLLVVPATHVPDPAHYLLARALFAWERSQLASPPIEGTLTAAVAASPEQGATLRGPPAWLSGEDRPADGEHVAYLFEPFGTYHVGVYDAASDSVHGKSGFTTWQPEVTAWFPLPKAHNGAVTPNTALYRANLIDPAAQNKVSVPPDELQVYQHVETLTESEQTPAAGKPEDA